MDRIAKLIARSGLCSRRDAEALINEGRVTHKSSLVETCGFKCEDIEHIKVDGKSLKKSPTKLWLYHKPVGLVVTHKDEQGRESIFDHLNLKERVISVGRLDKNTSGLLLLTNDGELARKLELPSNQFERVYKVRVFGRVNFNLMKETLSKPLTIDGVTYQPVEIELDQSNPSNSWIYLTISEGKNREIRRIMEYFGLKISRLIRIQYGPYKLANLSLEEIISAPLPKL